MVLTPFKVGHTFNVKNPAPKSLKSFVVYKFVWPGCNICYIDETTHHLTARIKERVEIDEKSYITENCFEIIGSISTQFWLKLKEVMLIIRKKPVFNKQQKHVIISIPV